MRSGNVARLCLAMVAMIVTSCSGAGGEEGIAGAGGAGGGVGGTNATGGTSNGGRIYDPTIGTSPTQTLNSVASVTLTLTDRPVLIEL
jgi:hypothetical protein